MATLYIHMGTPKTATTSIQMFCVENQEKLREQGYSYPLLDFVYPRVAHRRNGHFLVGRVFYPDKTENVEMEEELWEKGLAMIHQEFEKYPNVILSDENIWHSSLGKKFEFWEKILEDGKEHGYEVKAVVYLRRQDALANSWLSQQVKEIWNTNACIKWDSFQRKIRRIVLHYYNHLEKIAAVIGRENIIVRVFEREKFKGKGNTIFSDFLEAIGLEYKDDYQVTEQEANKSLTGNSQEILRIVNSVVPDNPHIRGLLRESALVCEELKDGENNFTMFSREELEAFLKRYEECNKNIARDYLHQEEDLFSTKIKEGERWTPNNRFMYEDIVRFFANVVVRQQETIEGLKGEVQRLKESRIESVKQYAKEMEEERREAAGDVMPEEEEAFQSISEIILNQKKDMEEMGEISKLVYAADRKIHSLRTENLILKNELIDVNLRNEALRKEAIERDRELKKMIKDLREDVFFYRLKRKMKHISGKDNQESK
ncbi:MAG: hypothetical protein Q4D60_01250 [Eubacteriales bacterium]|nr:hypothetical protein [Eubacteriales bacterium]